MNDNIEKEDVETLNVMSIDSKLSVQNSVNIIGVYDNEWDAIHKLVKRIKEESNKFNVSFIDGVGFAAMIPFAIDVIKIIQSKGAIDNGTIIECLIYGMIIIAYAIFFVYRTIGKPKHFVSSSKIESNIETLDERMEEIEKRLGIEKEE